MIAITPYVIILTLMAVVIIIITLRAFQDIDRKYARDLLPLLVVVAFAVCCMAFEFAFTAYSLKIFWSTLRFITFTVLPPSVLRLYLRYADNQRLLSLRSQILLHVIPFITLCMVTTNPLHFLFWTEREIMVTPYVAFAYNYSGPWFWLHSAYSYVLLLGAYGVLLAGILKKPRIYRGQGYIMLLGAVVSLLINAIYIFEIFTGLGDLTIPAIALACVCLYWAVYMHKPVKMIRLARTMVINALGTPVVIFDDKDTLIDANQSAMDMLTIKPDEIFSLNLSMFMTRLGFSESQNLDEHEIWPNPDTCYAVMDKILTDKRKVPVGRYIVFNDITRLKNIVNELEFSNTHDVLTGMFNRSVFALELKKIDRAENLPIALVSMNIYGMKFLNTVFGYDFGDRMIRLSSDAVSELTKGKGICARFSGDEFVIALTNTREPEAEAFVRQVLESANHDNVKQAAFNTDAKKKGSASYGAHISLSYGIAVKESRSENIDLVLKNAANRMFRNKLLESKAKSSEMFEFVKQVLQKNQYETEGYIERIQTLAQQIAEQLNFSPALCENMRLLSLTHDIGILGTPVDIIKKMGSLSNEEWEDVRLHTVRGYNIAMLFPELTPIAEDILCHHERYDGLGYPNGLSGEDIPIGAQIMLLVSEYDKLIHPQPPAKPYAIAEAVAKIEKQAGEMFSPQLVQAFTKVMACGRESSETGMSAGLTGQSLTAGPLFSEEEDAAMREILKLLDME